MSPVTPSPHSFTGKGELEGGEGTLLSHGRSKHLFEGLGGVAGEKELEKETDRQRQGRHVYAMKCAVGLSVSDVQLDGELFLDSLWGPRPFSFPYLELCLDPSVICVSLRACTASQLYPYLILYLTSLAICGPSLDQIIMAGSRGGEL